MSFFIDPIFLPRHYFIQIEVKAECLVDEFVERGVPGVLLLVPPRPSKLLLLLDLLRPSRHLPVPSLKPLPLVLLPIAVVQVEAELGVCGREVVYLCF